VISVSSCRDTGRIRFRPVLARNPGNAHPSQPAPTARSVGGRFKKGVLLLRKAGRTGPLLIIVERAIENLHLRESTEVLVGLSPVSRSSASTPAIREIKRIPAARRVGSESNHPSSHGEERHGEGGDRPQHPFP